MRELDLTGLAPKAGKSSDVQKSPPAPAENRTPPKEKANRAVGSSNDIRSKKRENEPYIDQHLELPQSLRTRFELLFVHSPELKRKGKNNFLIEAVEVAVETEEKRQKPSL